jgi:hypothetical protein
MAICIESGAHLLSIISGICSIPHSATSWTNAPDLKAHYTYEKTALLRHLMPQVVHGSARILHDRTTMDTSHMGMIATCLCFVVVLFPMKVH